MGLDRNHFYYGTKTGKCLDFDKLVTGRKLERQFMDEFEVFTRVHRNSVRGIKKVRSKWLDDWKCDSKTS
eukprot:11158273-Lingulodinium_polyedra.AAC.1